MSAVNKITTAVGEERTLRERHKCPQNRPLAAMMTLVESGQYMLNQLHRKCENYRPKLNAIWHRMRQKSGHVELRYFNSYEFTDYHQYDIALK